MRGEVSGIRRRLDIPGTPIDFPILQELKAKGITDYVAMPLHFSDGSIHAVTISLDRPGGFTTEELSQLYDMLPVLGRLMEIHATGIQPELCWILMLAATPASVYLKDSSNGATGKPFTR